MQRYRVILSIFCLLILAFVMTAIADRNAKAPDQELTAVQRACMDQATEMERLAAQADGTRAARHASALIDLVKLPNVAVMDAAMASMDAEERSAVIQEEAAICAKVASCFPNRPYQKIFNDCYGKAMEDRKTDGNAH